MKTFLGVFFLVLRLVIMAKAMYLLYNCYFNPENYKIDSLTWYVYFFIFDMWFVKTNEHYAVEFDTDEKENKEES
jgi:hypothetical protein